MANVNNHLELIEKKDAQIEYVVQIINCYTSWKRRIEEEDTHLWLFNQALKFWLSMKRRLEKKKEKLEKADQLDAYELKDGALKHMTRLIESYTREKNRIEEDTHIWILNAELRFWTSTIKRLKKQKRELEKAFDSNKTLEANEFVNDSNSSDFE